MTAKLKTKPFDAAEFLDTDEAVAAYLADAFDSGDDQVFQEALQVAARARGMSDVARSAGLGRESLYKALQPDAQPRFATVRKVMAALGVTLSVARSKSVAKRPADKHAVRRVGIKVAAKKAVSPAESKPRAATAARK